LVAPGATFTLEGSGSGYHTYQLVYNPNTQLSDLYVDGIKRIQNKADLIYNAAVEGGSRAIYSVAWGGENGGQVNFNFVQLTIGSVNFTAPGLTQMSQTCAVQGSTFNVTFTGTNLATVNAVVSDNPGVSGSIISRSDTSVTAIITIAPQAATGATTLGLTTLGGTAKMPFNISPAQFAYVTNYGSNTVSIIATATNTVVATVPVGANPVGVAITPDGAFAYVANYSSNTVSVIATATNTVAATVPVGLNPWGVTITPNGAFVYVTNYGSNTVSVITTATNTIVATVPVGANPASVAITSDGTFAYIANYGSNTVSVIATAANTVVATVPVGPNPWGVAIRPDGAFAYVTITGSGWNQRYVAVIATATNTLVGGVGLPWSGYANPAGAAISPNGVFAYVTNNAFAAGLNYHTVEVIATATNAVVATVPLGGHPLALSVTPDGKFVYVANAGYNIVSVIATATNTVVATVPVGGSPVWVAFTPMVVP
ncbi:beta-propeller fold lactonase family protein, partial [Geobacter sp.]|uniref:beta-propeller fold lactonase family protein n=1 Tax=Geobacter sp. TaxID=46610 RepID=UPI0027B950EF